MKAHMGMQRMLRFDDTYDGADDDDADDDNHHPQTKRHVGPHLHCKGMIVIKTQMGSPLSHHKLHASFWQVLEKPQGARSKST